MNVTAAPAEARRAPRYPPIAPVPITAIVIALLDDILITRRATEAVGPRERGGERREDDEDLQQERDRVVACVRRELETAHAQTRSDQRDEPVRPEIGRASW